MQTKLIEGVPPLANDHEIVAAIEAETDPWGSGGNAMDIAIISADGRVSRAIRATGLGEYMGIIGALKKLGLRTLPTAPVAHGIRFDDAFSA